MSNDEKVLETLEDIRNVLQEIRAEMKWWREVQEEQWANAEEDLEEAMNVLRD